MDEQELRALANTLRGELPRLIDDEEERRNAAADIETALALPRGRAKDALREVMRARPQTREWVAGQLAAEPDLDRGIPGLLGSPTGSLGVHFVCPEGDYDRFGESPTDDPGRCPNDGLKLVRAYD
jgi:hypothetical protein